MISTILTTSDANCLTGGFRALQPYAGATVIEEVLRRLVQSPVREIIVVTGYQRRVVERLLELRPCRLVNDWSWYLGDHMTSIRAGLGFTRSDATAALVCRADDLSITPDVVGEMIERMQTGGSGKLYRAAPSQTESVEASGLVLIPKSFWPTLQQTPVRAGVAGFLNTCAASLDEFVF